MNYKVKKIIKNWRVILAVVFVLFAYVSVNGGFLPNFWNEGAAIRNVVMNSSASWVSAACQNNKAPVSRGESGRRCPWCSPLRA